MKKSILSLLMLVFAGVTSTAMAQGVAMGASIEFEKDLHDYGDIPFEGNGTYSFKFTNTGSEPLMISNAKGSCGCTVPSWPKTPIAPGESGEIEVTYDTKRVGGISKSVTITSNAVNTPVKVIKISGNVLASTEVEEIVPPAQVIAIEKEVIVPPVVEARSIPEAPVVLTKAEIKAAAKAEKKRLKAEKKAAKKLLKKENKMAKEKAKLAKA